jgi:hypothetical protein
MQDIFISYPVVFQARLLKIKFKKQPPALLLLEIIVYTTIIYYYLSQHPIQI